MAYNDKHNLIFPLKSDYYDIDVFNQNFSKLADDLDRDIKAVETEAKNKDGGNADTVDGKHAKDFSQFKMFKDINEALNEPFTGMFKTDNMSGVSLLTNIIEREVSSDGYTTTIYDKEYIRIYGDEDNLYYVYSTAYASYEEGMITYSWEHCEKKEIEVQGHKHTKNDITDFPTSLPASGGNADTVGNKSADEFALADHIHNNYLEKNTTISITQGGTGATTASSARTNLGLGEASTREITTGISSGSSRVPTSDAVYRELQKYVKVGSVDFLGKTSQYITIEGTDFNTITGMGVYTIGTEDGTEMSTSKNQPVGAYPWGTLAVFASGSYGLTQVYYTHTGDTYVRGLYGDVNWNSWKKTGGEADNIIKKSFSTQKECWYRIAETKNSQAGGIFVISVDDKNSHNAMVVISASQQYASNAYSTQKLQELSYSTLNGCLSAFRIVLDNNNCYLEFKTNDTITNGKTGSIEVQFLGRGWNVLDTVITDNTATNIFKEITLS